MKKSELREMIRSIICEELEARNSLTEGAFAGTSAEGGFLDTSKNAGGAKKTWADALEGQKTKTVKAKDLKPGMITSTGEIKKVTSLGWVSGQPSVEVSYGGIGAQGSHAADVVAADKDYEVLDESFEEPSEESDEEFTEEYDEIFENLFNLDSKKNCK